MGICFGNRTFCRGASGRSNVYRNYLGKAFLRQTNIFNAIAVSATILLIVNPYLTMEVGFQLSYLALAGIVAIHPWLYRQLYVKNWLLDKNMGAHFSFPSQRSLPRFR
jgi:competence protein ComEC